jgi:hypothetical protein
MTKSEVIRPFAMIALMFCLLLGLTVVSFSKPTVLDDVTAATYAQRYVPATSALENVTDTGSDYVAKFDQQDAGMDIEYSITVNKASQEITGMHVEINNGGDITVKDTHYTE